MTVHLYTVRFMFNIWHRYHQVSHRGNLHELDSNLTKKNHLSIREVVPTIIKNRVILKKGYHEQSSDWNYTHQQPVHCCTLL